MSLRLMLSYQILIAFFFAKGQVIGESDRHASKPASDPQSIKNRIGTIMHSLFDVGELRLQQGVAREVIQAASYDPISGLS